MKWNPLPPVAVWIALLCAVVIRAAAPWADLEGLEADPDSYSRLAVNWAESGVYGFETLTGRIRPTAFRPPVYPWVLSWLVSDQQLSSARVAGLHGLLCAATVLMTFSLAKSLRLRWPWLPAIAVAFDPLMLRQSQLVMTESLMCFAVVGIWRLWLVLFPSGASPCAITESSTASADDKSSTWRFRLALASLLGFAFGISILIRPTAAPWAVLCILAAASMTDRPPPNIRVSRPQLTVALLMFSGIAICVGLWTFRNARELGKPVWATTHGGYTLLLANNPQLYEHFREYGPSRDWDAEPFHRAWASRTVQMEGQSPRDHEYWFADRPSTSFPPSDNELGDDELAYSSARATIAREPAMFVVACFYRLGWFWAMWPANAGSLVSLVIAGWYLMWYSLAGCGVWTGWRKRRWKPWIPGLALVISLSAVHAVYWSNMRMRGPTMVAVYLMAGVCAGRESQPSEEA